MERLEDAEMLEQILHLGDSILGGRTGRGARHEGLGGVCHFLPAITTGFARAEHSDAIFGLGLVRF